MGRLIVTMVLVAMVGGCASMKGSVGPALDAMELRATEAPMAGFQCSGWRTLPDGTNECFVVEGSGGRYEVRQ